MSAKAVVDGCNVAVLVDGLKLPEYNAPELDSDDYDNQLKQLISADQAANPAHTLDLDGITYVRKFVEAKSDKRFTIRFDKAANTPRNCHHLGIKIEVDGYKSAITHETIKPENTEARWVSACDRLGTGSARDGFYWEFFKFGDVQTTDDDPLSMEEIKRLAAEVKDIGVLRVYLYQMMEAPSLVFNTHSSFGGLNEVKDEIPEQALKGRAVTHATRFDKERTSVLPPPQPADRFLRADKLPCAIWEFQYRSKKGLTQEQVVPRIEDSAHDGPGLSQAHPPLSVNDRPRRAGLYRAQKRAHVRYKETRRHDGRVQIELESDDEADVTPAEISRDPTQSIRPQPSGGMSLSQRSSPSIVTQQAAEDSARRDTNQDRRVRYESVEDEESVPRPTETNSLPADGPVLDDDIDYDTDETVI